MKKLMIAAAIVCAAAMSQAASVAWDFGETSGKYVWEAGGASKASGTMYIFNQAVQSQQGILDAVNAHGADWLKYVTCLYDGSDTSKANPIKTTVSSGTWTAPTWSGTVGAATDTPTPDYIADTKYYFYGVIVDDDKVFISNASNKAAASGNVSLVNNPDSISKAAIKDTTIYSSGGWYAVDVPEPTSAMLLLLGVAGLALKRKRA